MALELNNAQRPLTFTRPLTSLACHNVRMFVRCWPT